MWKLCFAKACSLDKARGCLTKGSFQASKPVFVRPEADDPSVSGHWTTSRLSEFHSEKGAGVLRLWSREIEKKKGTCHSLPVGVNAFHCAADEGQKDNSGRPRNRVFSFGDGQTGETSFLSLSVRSDLNVLRIAFSVFSPSGDQKNPQKVPSPPYLDQPILWPLLHLSKRGPETPNG